MKVNIKPLIARHFGVDVRSVEDHQRFKEDFGADSLDSIELIMAVEEEYNITISDDENIYTVYDLQELIIDKLYA